jgi:hypothetical protein
MANRLSCSAACVITPVVVLLAARGKNSQIGQTSWSVNAVVIVVQELFEAASSSDNEVDCYVMITGLLYSVCNILPVFTHRCEI